MVSVTLSIVTYIPLRGRLVRRHITGAVWDIDDTLAERIVDPRDPDGARSEVSDETWAALASFASAGGWNAIASGRRAGSFLGSNPELWPADVSARFRFIVCELGAVVIYPSTGEVEYAHATPLGIQWSHQPPDGAIGARLVQEMIHQGVPVTAIWKGTSVVSSKISYIEQIAKAVTAAGLSDQVTLFRNGLSVDIVPCGIDKGLGLRHAVAHVGEDIRNCVGVGNSYPSDWPFLTVCGASAAVANADPPLKRRVTYRLPGDRGVGAQWLCAYLSRSLATRHLGRSGREVA